jgi:hypothetical protein
MFDMRKLMGISFLILLVTSMMTTVVSAQQGDDKTTAAEKTSGDKIAVSPNSPVGSQRALPQARNSDDTWTTAKVCKACGCTVKGFVCDCGLRPSDAKLQCIRNGGPKRVALESGPTSFVSVRNAVSPAGGVREICGSCIKGRQFCREIETVRECDLVNEQYQCKYHLVTISKGIRPCGE